MWITVDCIKDIYDAYHKDNGNGLRLGEHIPDSSEGLHSILLTYYVRASNLNI